jgi:hypothetical protein
VGARRNASQLTPRTSARATTFGQLGSLVPCSQFEMLRWPKPARAANSF